MTWGPGRTLGRYRIEATLGRGGMAEVFRATDTKLGRAVAVKVIQPAFAAQPQFVERFLREARLVAGLEHPNILPVYDFGEEDGAPFLVMPYLEGGTLAQRMDGTPIPLAQVAPWIRQLAEALDFAHQAGVLHRDVKPANILIGKGDRPLLADFGIAKAAESGTRLTATGVVVGTPVYMAPELALGKSASPQSDLYALAVLTFELVTGRAPFAGESALSLMHQHVQTPPPLASSLVATLPPHLDAVLREALAKEPEQRQRSCRAFADGLGSALTTGERAEIATGVPGPWSSLAAQPTLHMPSTPERTTAVSAPAAAGTRSRTPPAPTAYAPVPRRAPWRWAVGIAALAVLAVGGVWKLGGNLTGGSEPPAPAPATSSPVAPAPAAPPTAPPSRPSLPGGRAETSGATSAPSQPQPPERSTARPTVGGASTAQSTAEASLGSPASGAPPAVPAMPAPAESPASLAASAADAVSGGGESSDAFRGGRQRLFDPAVGFQRPTAASLAAWRDEARSLLAKRPEASQAKLVEEYTAGALAYLDGRGDEAKRHLDAVLTRLPREGAFSETSPLRFVRRAAASALAPWHIAVAFGDARHEAAGLLDTVLAARPDDQDAALARAFVRHLDGDHGAALAAAAASYQRAPSAAAAQLQADESLHLGRADDAVRWYRTAIAQGAAVPGVLPVVAAQIAEHALGRLDEAREILDAACAQGDAMACRDERTSADAAAGRPGLRPFARRPVLGARRKPPG